MLFIMYCLFVLRNVILYLNYNRLMLMYIYNIMILGTYFIKEHYKYYYF